MWPNNTQLSPSPSPGSASGEGSSSQLAPSWSPPPSTIQRHDSSSTDVGSVDQEHDQDAFDQLPIYGVDRREPAIDNHPSDSVLQSTEGPFNDDYMSDDDDSDGGGVHLDAIMTATDALTHQDFDLESANHGPNVLDPQNDFPFDHAPIPPPPPPPLLDSLPLYMPFSHITNSHNSHLAAALPPNMVTGVQQTDPEDVPEAGEATNNPDAHHVQVTHMPQILHPNPWMAPNAHALGPENYNLSDFIRVWAWQNGIAKQRLGVSRDRVRYPWPEGFNAQMSREINCVDYHELEGDRYDVQGVDWENLGVTRSEARERRLLTYKNYVNIPNSDRWQMNQGLLPCTESYFRFRRLDVRKNVNLTHFQLRNVLASASRSQVFYPGHMSVHEFNPITGKGKVGLKSKETAHFQVSTLAADYDTLIAGGFFGEYCFRRLSSDLPGEVHEGTITGDSSGITNHVQLHLSRSDSGPKAALASNDNGFRVLDIETEKFVSETMFSKPINCSAISPDRRLRVMVGDQTEVLIAKAEADGQPEILQRLKGHGDFGFACDWADDGWTIATGFQDKSVKIWDARFWTDSHGRAKPVSTLRSEIAGVRSLRFSPLGSGKRVLVAAEEADFVNIFDAQTFQSKQTFDFFGEIGGVSFVNEGQDLHILCCDRTRGGLYQLERCGVGAERNHDPDSVGLKDYLTKWDNTSHDWKEFQTTPRRLPRYSKTRLRRRATAFDDLEFC